MGRPAAAMVILAGAQMVITASVVGSMVWALVVGVVWWGQEQLIFPARVVPESHLEQLAQRHQVVVHHPTTEDGTRLYAWHVPGDGKRLLLFFHGNGGGVTAAPWFASKLPGWDVASFSYRGYPGSEGVAGEAGMAQDARAIWRWATEDLGFSPDQIVVQARSLGGGVSAHLLTDVKPAAVVWDSTFHSLEELAAGQFPFAPTGLLLRHPFRTFERAPRIAAPVLLLHGNADTLIPVEHAHRNLALLPDVRYLELPGIGHGDWLLDHPSAHRAWTGFLAGAVSP